MTAGNASQITDGAAPVLIMLAERARELGVSAGARLVDFVVGGDGPQLMLTANIPATRRVLERSGLRLVDIHRFKLNAKVFLDLRPSQCERRSDRTRTSAYSVGHAARRDARQGA
ncbi:MAG: hypothetical protein P8O03_01940 [Ilumatobacter sp.]|nr:hypothetical protein [Ilumatobacter sp.]